MESGDWESFERELARREVAAAEPDFA